MSLNDKLAEWQGAQLISQAQVDAIVAYEQRGARPYLSYALGGLGALAVAIGLVSLVAANWDAIPAMVKLGLNLAVLVGVALGILRAQKVGSQFVREALLLVFYGLVLASIGLVSQIYQLGGEAHEALLLWAVITAPAMLMLRTGFGATVWLCAMQGTWLWNVSEWLNHAYRHVHHELFWSVAAVAYLTSLGLAALSAIPGLMERRPALGNAARGLGTAQLVIAATLAQQIWYGHIRQHDVEGIALEWVVAVVVASFAAAVGLPRWLRAADTEGGTAEAALSLRVFVVYAGLSSVAPLLIEHEGANLVAALSFLLLWGILGWAGLRLRAYRLFQLATAFLALRIVVIYFEVIGSLLESGLGLISGGVLTLVVAWYWRKKTVQIHDQFEARPAAAGPPPSAAGQGETP